MIDLQEFWQDEVMAVNRNDNDIKTKYNIKKTFAIMIIKQFK